MHRAVILGLALLLLAPAAAAAPTFVITRDVNIGGFDRGARVDRAVAVFGQPTSRLVPRGGWDKCEIKWTALGVSMVTHHVAAVKDPCGPEGRHVSTTVTDRRWRTSVGLKIGDPLAKLRKLYPRGYRDQPGVWWLTIRQWAGLPFPGLEAKVRNGKVVALTVYGPRTPS